MARRRAPAIPGRDDSTGAPDDVPDGPTDLLSADPSASGDPRARIEALMTAARDLSDTCADLADELRPDAGSDDSPADRAAALLDEAASAVRATLGLLGSASAALDGPDGSYPTVAIPAQAAVLQDPFTGPSPWSRLPAPPDTGTWTPPRPADPPGWSPADPAGQPATHRAGGSASEETAGTSEERATHRAGGSASEETAETSEERAAHSAGGSASEETAGTSEESAEPRETVDVAGGAGGARAVEGTVEGEPGAGIGEDGRGAEDEGDPVGEPEVLPPPRAVATTWPDAFREAPPRSVPEEDLVAATHMDPYGGTGIGEDPDLDRDDGEGLAAVPAALAGWVVVDPDEADGEPVALEHRPTGPLPVASVAAAATGPTMLTVSTDEEPYADDPHPYGDGASTEPRSLTLVPPLPPGEPDEWAKPGESGESGEWEKPDQPEELSDPGEPSQAGQLGEPGEPEEGGSRQDSIGTLPPPVDLPTEPAEPAEPAEQAEQAEQAESRAVEAVAGLAVAGSGPWVPEPAWAATPDDPWPGRSVWAVDPVPGSSPLGDGLPAYPLNEPDLSYETFETGEVPVTPAEAALPPEPLDDPAAAVVARQVEAARRHLQAALVVANKEEFGSLLTAVEQALTAVTDLARETRGVLPEHLSDRTFPGEARFLCTAPWEGVELVGREAYGEEAASPAGLARLLRALGYDAESTTSTGGVVGVQVRSDRYAAHVALVEPAGGGRQRWSGALEWTDRAGAGRTWAETLGPVELTEDELARRVDELLRRSVSRA